MEAYDTVVEALNGLKERGYTTNFNIAFDKLICSEKKHVLNPDEFEITEVYRFEGDTNPGDEDPREGRTTHGSAYRHAGTGTATIAAPTARRSAASA